MKPKTIEPDVRDLFQRYRQLMNDGPAMMKAEIDAKVKRTAKIRAAGAKARATTIREITTKPGIPAWRLTNVTERKPPSA